MIALERGPENNGLERYVSVCDKNMYFYLGGAIQMSTVIGLV